MARQKPQTFTPTTDDLTALGEAIQEARNALMAAEDFLVAVTGKLPAELQEAAVRRAQMCKTAHSRFTYADRRPPAPDSTA